MKRTLLTLLSILCLLNGLVAQTKMSTYYLTYFKKSYDVEASVSKKDTSAYDIWINGPSMDRLHDEVCIKFNSKSYDDFLTFFNSAKSTYAKWSETARVNNVTELDKDIDIKAFNCTGGFKYGKWNFDFNVLLTARAKIIDGKMVLIISTGEMKSSSNDYIDHKGLAFVFQSPDEVDEFESAANLQKVKDLFKKKANTDNLFN